MAKKLLIFINWLLVVCLIACSAFVLYVQINFRKRYEVSLCNQYSMLPNINLDLYLNDYVYLTGEEAEGVDQPGDYAVLDKKDKNYKPGDIVSAVVDWEILQKKNEAVVKRLVGLPGDKIKIVEKLVDANTVYELYVNDSLLYAKPRYEAIGVNKNSGETVVLDNYLTYYQYTTWINSNNKNVTTDESGEKCLIMGEDEYLILGDNWDSSHDCMDEAKPIKAENLGDKVVAIINYYGSYRWQMFKCAFKVFFAQIRKR